MYAPLSPPSTRNVEAVTKLDSSEVARGQALALQAALHVGQREQHGVDLATVDGGAQLLQRHRSEWSRDIVPIKV